MNKEQLAQARVRRLGRMALLVTDLGQIPSKYQVDGEELARARELAAKMAEVYGQAEEAPPVEAPGEEPVLAQAPEPEAPAPDKKGKK